MPNERNRSARDKRAQALSKLNEYELAKMYAEGIPGPDGQLRQALSSFSEVRKWRKDELISAILTIEYPSEPDSREHSGYTITIPQPQRVNRWKLVVTFPKEEWIGEPSLSGTTQTFYYRTEKVAKVAAEGFRAQGAWC